MPQGDIQIIEFKGEVAESKKDQVATYVLAIDGRYQQKYKSPSFGYLPKEWREKYQVGSYNVGSAASWREFYLLCNDRLEDIGPLDSSSGSATPQGSSTSGSSPSARGTEKAAPTGTSIVKPDKVTSSGSSGSSDPNEDEFAELPSPMRLIFEDFLDEPPERPISLRFEVTGYLSLLKGGAQRLTSADSSRAEAIAASCLELLEQVSGPDSGDQAHQMVQAAIRYFTVADDATHDWEEGGFDDDAAVLNFVAGKLNRDDLKIPVHGNEGDQGA